MGASFPGVLAPHRNDSPNSRVSIDGRVRTAVPLGRRSPSSRESFSPCVAEGDRARPPRRADLPLRDSAGL